MQVLGLERDDVIISLFASIVTLASKLGSNIIVTLFCFCSENSTNVLTCLLLKQLITRTSNGLLPVTKGFQIWDPFFLERYALFLFCVALCLSAVFGSQKVVFAVQDPHWPLYRPLSS